MTKETFGQSDLPVLALMNSEASRSPASRYFFFLCNNPRRRFDTSQCVFAIVSWTLCFNVFIGRVSKRSTQFWDYNNLSFPTVDGATGVVSFFRASLNAKTGTETVASQPQILLEIGCSR